jgi:N-acetyl sugar amidotransferase
MQFDAQGICAACRYAESKHDIDWAERQSELRELVDEIKESRKNAEWDAIVPVSGGKDSTWQVKTLIEQYGLRLLLVTYNHSWNSRLGNANLRNLVERSGCDLIRYSTSPASMRKLARWAIKAVGDPTWAYHAGIMSFPMQIAVKYNIPWIFWGENGFAEIVGLVSLNYRQEFTKWQRSEHSMRGRDVGDILEDATARKEGITKRELAPFVYPTEEEIERVGLRGIYLGNYYPWDALAQAKEVVNEWGFQMHPGPRELTFALYPKTDDAAQGAHIWPRFLKYGYGRCTDDVSTEIRHGRMTREEGIDLIAQYDHREPSLAQWYLDWLGISREEFFGVIDGMRDPAAWERSAGGWKLKDWVGNHRHDDGVEAARVSPAAERTFDHKGYYWPGRPGDSEWGGEPFEAM